MTITRIAFCDKRFRDRFGETGVALIMVLIALFVITLLGFALTGMGMVAMTMTTNDREGAEAFYIADAGIEHAKALLLSQGWNSFDGFLQAGDGVACSGDELATAPGLPTIITAPYAPVAELVPAAGRPFPPAGTYWVAVCDDHQVESTTNNPPDLPNNDPNADVNGTILVRSTGIGRDGATATLEILLGRRELPALLVCGSLRLNGNPEIMGDAGGIHADGTLEINGNPCAEQYFSSSGSINQSGTPQGGAACSAGAEDLRSGEEPIDCPVMDFPGLRPQADYILANDGNIYDQGGNPVVLPGWNWDPGGVRWVAGNDIPQGTYYAEGSINISGNPGSGPPGTPPLPLTLIADGYVEISGNPTIIPKIGGSPPYAVVAGTDLKMNGNPANAYTGVFYAGDQIDFGGNPQIQGQVIAANQGDCGYPCDPGDPNENRVELDGDGFMSVSGNPSITYDGGSGLAGAEVTDWRECRGPDPANPCGAP